MALMVTWSLIQYIIMYVKKYSEKTEIEDIDKVISRIERARDEETAEEETVDKEGCYYKTGCITRVTLDHVLIDDRYAYEKNDNLSSNLNIGDNVHYLALLREAKLKVVKIIDVIDGESWDSPQCISRNDESSQHSNMIQRSLIARVTGREGRVIIIEPNNIHINLNKIQSEFIPLIGDWITVESLVEVNESSPDLCGEILEVDKIKPLRSKLDVGVITKYDSLNQVGVIDKNVIFHKSACEPGYIPRVNDKVVSDSIESDQGIHRWRSLTVVPLILAEDKTSHWSSVSSFYSKLSDTNDLLKNKNGIVIDDELKFNLDIEEEGTLTVAIRNTSSDAHVLRESRFVPQKTPSQLTVITSPTDMCASTLVINPAESASCTFKCKAKFVGRSEELYIFNFEDFKIGRLFHITVNARNLSQNAPSASVALKGRRKVNFDNLNEEEDVLTYIPGVRPFKPPAFVKVRNGVFKVPRYIWNVISNNVQNDKSQIECEIALSDEIPCLLKQLTFDTYKERFHILLYLEEIAQTLNIQQYDMKGATMRRCGDYLVLEVPGLAEKRPSLLVGDRAVVSFEWDTSQGKLKYEGYIHKVGSNEIFLKFNMQFHSDYNNEACEVTFKCSQTTLQRCHNAVNLALNRLGPDILFPTKVVEKEPQFHLEEYEVEEKPVRFMRIGNRANESMSSAGSSNSIASGSETSVESTVSRTSPRMSVVERLFNVKLIEGSPEVIAKTAETQSTNLKTNLTSCNNETNIAVNNAVTKKAGEETTQNDELQPYINQIKRRKLNWYNKNLNYYQREAVRNILKGLARSLPYVIFGPPGTGKTITLCETILQLFTVIPESRLLVATPSNSSANLIAERLLDNDVLKPGDLVRLIAHHCLYDNSIPARLLPYCATAELGEERRGHDERVRCDSPGKGPRLNCTMSVLGRHRITIGTCSTLGLLYNMGFPRGHFSHILVDEAGQATEPEIMIPLNFIHSDEGQVVLVGDPMQLGPVVQSKLAMRFGLGESFLSRVLHQFPYQRDDEGFENYYDPRLVTQLLINYRSLPEILELSNSLFYHSELLPQISSKKSQEAKLLETLRAELPERNGSPPAIVFHGVDGENLRDSESPSWYNPQEATQVYLYLLKLYKYGLEPDDIGIITPYQKQVMQIRDLLFELDLKIPKVSSVEGFQGQERKVIILSAVRSCNNLIDEDIKHALGFVASPKRLNVAITRARALLIILGNPKLLSMDPHWRSVLIHCMNRGAYTGCNFQHDFCINKVS
ncbi:PREDICTED: probable RNA helicase armi [Dinoponera quadriceps]|uniref:RNA helicase n=1 Tax=Dinoponera quadriceps TaxID=609295 RepID=A0A6P3XIX3_DINQU|nr:PREDICTED: probable RNA helicase armi [Dinoponera quadriceps]